MELRQYLVILWHWAWLIMLGVLIAGGTAYIVGKNTTPIYRASTHLLISQRPGDGGSEYTQVLLNERLARTYTELIKKRPVLEKVVNQLDLPYGPNGLGEQVTVGLVRDTHIIAVQVEDASAAQAALIANTLADVFINENQELQSARYTEAVVNWEKSLSELAGLIENLETQISAIGLAETAAEEASLARLELQLNQARSSYSQTFNQLQSLRVSQAREISNIVVVELAEASRAPIRPRVLQNTLLAAVVGGMLALGIVFLIEYMDDTVKSPDQVAEDTGLSIMGTIAVIEGATSAERLVAQRMPRAPVSEAYRTLRTNLSFSAVDGGLRSLMVSSSSPAEGKSTTAANLAVVMAQSGKQVILIDADLRRPTLHKIFSVGNERGLTTALLDSQSPLSDHYQETSTPGLRLLTSGPLPPNPAELLNSQRLRQVLESLQTEVDMAIFDSPPVLSVTDASILAAQVDGTILVVKAAQTRRDALSQAVESLQRTEANMLGVVLNQLRTKGRGYYYYRHYSYEYASEGARPANSKWLPAWVSALISRS